METLIKADMFFFISSLSTILTTVLIAFLLYYLVRAGRNLYLLTEMLKGSVKDSEEFINDLRERLEDNMMFRMFFPPARKRRASKSDRV